MLWKAIAERTQQEGQRVLGFLMVMIVSNLLIVTPSPLKMDMTERDPQLANLSCKLHSTCKFFPRQIRQ